MRLDDDVPADAFQSAQESCVSKLLATMDRLDAAKAPDAVSIAKHRTLERDHENAEREMLAAAERMAEIRKQMDEE